MKAIVFLLIVLMLFSGVSATKSTSDISTGGNGGVIMSNQAISSSVAVNLDSPGNFNNQAYDRTFIALGYSTLDAKSVTNDSLYHTLIAGQDVEFSDAALVSDTYSMEDNKDIKSAFAYMGDDPTPSYQHANAEFVQIGSGGGRYSAEGVIADADMTTSMRAEGNVGGVSEKHYAVARAGFDPSSNTMNYEKIEKGRSFYGDKNGTGYQGYLDWIWKDHSVPFEIINETNSTETNLTNST